jgi:hypothetical protein
MANYRKSFNFRNGVQVDNDNFIVNANGLVGIGTSIPTEDLDVNGNVKVVGFVTTTNFYAGIGTINNFSSTDGNITNFTVDNITIGGNTIDNIIGYAVTGWITNDNGIGLHTTSRIGIGSTSTPSEQLLVIGDSRIIGVLTATSFSGPLTGTASTATNLADAANITTGTISADRLSGSYTINVAGTATTATNLADAANITTGTISADRLSGSYTINVAGTATTATNLADAANITTGTISTDRLSGSYTISIAGIASTATKLETARDFSISGDLEASALSFDGSGNINLTSTLSNSFSANTSGIITASNFSGPLTGTATTATKLETARDFSISGDLEASALSFDGSGNINLTSTLSNNFSANTSGIITANQIYSSNTLYGVDLSLSGVDSSIEINGSNSASISIGNTEVGIGTSYASFSYSNKSLNISNFDIGDINSYLQAGTTGLTTGRFNWYDGDTGILLMALTHQGRLGIGRTDPDETFEVVGTSTVTSDSYVGNDLYVANDLNVTGSISGNFTLPDPITSNVNTTSGISTFGEIHVFGGVTSKIAIGTDSPDVDLDAKNSTAKFGTVAINTTSTNYDLNVGGTGNFLLNVRSEGGFYSSGSYPVEIYVDGSNLIFNVAGIGSVSLALS